MLRKALAFVLAALVVAGCGSKQAAVTTSTVSTANGPEAVVISAALPKPVEFYLADPNTGTTRTVPSPFAPTDVLTGPMLAKRGGFAVKANDVVKYVPVSFRHALNVLGAKEPPPPPVVTADAGREVVALSVAPDDSKVAVASRPANASGETDTLIEIRELTTKTLVGKYSYRGAAGPISLGWSPASDWVFGTQDETHIVYFRVDAPDTTARVLITQAAGTFVVTG